MQHCKIKKEQGYGDQVWKIVGSDTQHYHLQSMDGKTKKTIYKHHTYSDKETVELNIKSSNAIGLNKRSKK